MVALPTESALSSDTYIGGKNVEEIAQEIEMGGECGWHPASVGNCGTYLEKPKVNRKIDR